MLDATQSFSVTFLAPQESISLTSQTQSSKQTLSTEEKKEIKSQTQRRDYKVSSKKDLPQHSTIPTKACESIPSPSFTKREQVLPPIQRGTQEVMTTIAPLKGNPEPIYPIEARENKIEGTVWLRLTLLPSGAVLQVEAIPPFTSPILQDVAVQTAKKWHFHIINGDNKSSLVRDIPIDFKLE